MFKFRSYDVKKATEKDEKKQPSSASKTPSYSTLTLKKPPRKEKKKASPNEITLAGNKQSPEYRRSTSASLGSSASANASVKTWSTNKTYKSKKEKEQEEKVNESLNTHKKLVRQ